MKMMITNGGPHPADKWADMTADAILDLIAVSEDSNTPEALAARAAKRDLRPVLFDIFNDHHSAVQGTEQRHLTATVKTCEHAEAHVQSPLDVEPHLPVMSKVFNTLAATPFAAHFAKPEVQAILTSIVGQHTADVMHIERRWHQDGLVAVSGA